MLLTLDNLKQAGAFTGAPVKKDITWEMAGRQHEATVYVRPLSYHSTVNDLQALQNKGTGAAGRIAACICDEQGKPVLSVADITGEADPDRGPLDGNLTMALLTAIYEVQNAGKTSPSAS